MEAQLQPLRHLLKCWRWVMDDRYGVMVFVMFQDGLTLQLDVGEVYLHADIFSTFAPYEPQALTWVLSHNFRRVWKARVARPQKGPLQIYLGAIFPRSRLAEVGQVLWEGWQEALMWRGQFDQREVESVSPAHIEA